MNSSYHYQLFQIFIFIWVVRYWNGKNQEWRMVFCGKRLFKTQVVRFVYRKERTDFFRWIKATLGWCMDWCSRITNRVWLTKLRKFGVRLRMENHHRSSIIQNCILYCQKACQMTRLWITLINWCHRVLACRIEIVRW